MTLLHEHMITKQKPVFLDNQINTGFDMNT